MASHSVADAKNNLSQLIDRALEGETVVITRHGRSVVRLVPEQPADRPVSLESLAWLKRVRVGKTLPSEDAAAAVRRMRDEGP
jgi:prevent-host-death family protein